MENTEIKFEKVICGFELFRTRLSTEKIDLKAIENLHEVTIPYWYRLFIETFNIDRFKRNIKYCDNNSVLGVGFVKYLPQSYDSDTLIEINNFFSPEDTFGLEFEQDEEWSENGYYAIASLPLGTLLLATKDKEKDHIIHFTAGEEYVAVASNIFEFVRNLALIVYAEEKLHSGKNISCLYQNWGENFWRVREKSATENKKNK